MTRSTQSTWWYLLLTTGWLCAAAGWANEIYYRYYHVWSDSPGLYAERMIWGYGTLASGGFTLGCIVSAFFDFKWRATRWWDYGLVAFPLSFVAYATIQLV